MNTVWNARKNRTHLSALAYPASERPLHRGGNGFLAGFFCQSSDFDKGLQIEKNPFF